MQSSLHVLLYFINSCNKLIYINLKLHLNEFSMPFMPTGPVYGSPSMTVILGGQRLELNVIAQ